MTGEEPGFLRWRSWGTGGRRALLLHGTGSSSATWSTVGPALAAAGWRVKAPDLPAHGASPRVNDALTPDVAASWVKAELAERAFDLVVGHGFGAAVALALLSRHGAELVVLEEPLGPDSVDWSGEAMAVSHQVAAARRDPAGAYADLRAQQPQWTDDDCRNAVRDLAACAVEDVADGLRLGSTWPTLRPEVPDVPTLVLAAAAAESRLSGTDRQTARELADSFVEVAGGHALHRDRPDQWLRAVLGFTG